MVRPLQAVNSMRLLRRGGRAGRQWARNEWSAIRCVCKRRECGHPTTDNEPLTTDTSKKHLCFLLVSSVRRGDRAGQRGGNCLRISRGDVRALGECLDI